MIRVSVLYPNSPGTTFDMRYYIDSHLQTLVKGKLGAALKRMEIDHGVGGAHRQAQRRNDPGEDERAGKVHGSSFPAASVSRGVGLAGNSTQIRNRASTSSPAAT
jgi:hypothetical protein